MQGEQVKRKKKGSKRHHCKRLLRKNDIAHNGHQFVSYKYIILSKNISKESICAHKKYRKIKARFIKPLEIQTC